MKPGNRECILIQRFYNFIFHGSKTSIHVVIQSSSPETTSSRTVMLNWDKDVIGLIVNG